jgi:mono/diheme cytochrome c family protein
MRLVPNWSVATALTVCVLALLTAAFAWLTRPHVLTVRDVPVHDPDPLSGERLFHAGGCASCHGADLAGGMELATAFGTFRVPNISPEPEVGIGSWTILEFLNAMQRGVSPQGKHYYPAFPYASYARMSLSDLVDLKSYLDSFEPVRNSVAGHELGLPWSIRRGIGLWKLSYLDDEPVLQVPSDDEFLERGRYLVEAVGHCGECHTPRDRFGGLRRERWLAGGPSPDGEGRVPNITAHGDGLAEWSTRDIERYLGSGFTPDYDTVGGSMARVQENLARLPATDRAAIAAYLKAVAPLPDQPD